MARVRRRGGRAGRVLRPRLESGGGSLPDAQPGARSARVRADRPRRAARYLDAAAVGAAWRDPASRAAAMACRAGARAPGTVVGVVWRRVADRRQPGGACVDSAGAGLGASRGAVVQRHVLRIVGAVARAAGGAAAVRWGRHRGGFPVGLRGRLRARASGDDAAALAVLHDDPADRARHVPAGAHAWRGCRQGAVYRRLVSPPLGAGAIAINTMVRSSARAMPCGMPAGAAMKSPGPARTSRSPMRKVAFPRSTT